MSLATREIIRRYRAELSTRPDGATHVMDSLGISHVVLGVPPKLITACRIVVEDDRDIHPLLIHENHGARLAIPTWNDVDCMACLRRRKR
jgi:predicted phosphatase